MPSSTFLKFTLKVGSLAPDFFRVQTFDLGEEISSCYKLGVHVGCAKADIPYADLVGKKATLVVEGKDYSTNHHGVVVEFDQHPDSSESFGHESYAYSLVIRPHFYLLDFNSQNRIFQNKSAKEIIEEVLKTETITHEFNVQGSLRKREYTVQYNESDLNFVQRLLEDEGIYYYFDHSGDKEKVIFADSVNGIKPILHIPEVDLMHGSGLSHMGKEDDSADHVMSIVRKQKMVTGKVTIKDYNDRTPAVSVIGSASKPGQGEDYRFGPQALNAAEAARIATLRAEMHAVERVKLHGNSICRSFRAGMRFKLIDPQGGSHFEGTYTLISVHHHGDQSEGFESDAAHLIYTNGFDCIPADIVFRPKLNASKPKIYGIQSAKVDGQEGQYAYLDEDGRYHAKLNFDLTDKKDGQASLPIRMNQPYGGPNYGMHFPVHTGNEILLSFEDGDPDRPIVLGTVPNPAHGSPVNKRNNSESIIRTASGHLIRLDDKEGKTIVEITTKGKHSITLNDDPAHQEIRIKTTNANELVFDDKNKHISMMTPEGAHTLKMDYDKKVFSVQTKYGHKFTMDDEAKKIALQTKDGHILDLDDDKKLLSLQDGKGKHVFQIDAGGDLVSITTEGDMQVKAKGALNIEAKEINMEAKQGAINVKAAQDIVMEAANVNAKAKQKVTLEATLDASMQGMNLKLEGKMNVDIKAGVKNTVTGLMTNLEAQAVNTVKGAIVMIN